MKMIEPTIQMKGGIIINDNIGSQIQGDVNFESCFCYFVKNSNWEYINGSNLSASGVIFKCSLLEGVESPFINIRLGNLGKPITELILKFVILHNERGNYRYFFNENNEIKEKEKKYENSERFLNEIQIQNELTREDLLFLDPICPFLIYSGLVNENAWPSFYNKLFNEETQLNLLENIELFENFHDFKQGVEAREIARKFNESENVTNVSMMYLSQLIEHCHKKNLSLGFIGMEMLENSYPLYNYFINAKTENEKHVIKILANVVIYESIQMAIKGVVHGDLHIQNVFIKENYTPYFNEEIPIRAVIIDYGYAAKINITTRTNIIQKWNEICDIPEENSNVQLLNEKMGELLRMVFNSPRIDGMIVIFDWVKALYNPEYIYKIHQKRMTCIENTIIPLLKRIDFDENDIDTRVYHFTRTGGRVIKENKSRFSFLSKESSASSFKPSKKSKTSKMKSSQKISKKNKSADSYKMFVSKKSFKGDVSFEEALKELKQSLQTKHKNVKSSTNASTQDIKNINNQINEYFSTLNKNNKELEKKLTAIGVKKKLSTKSAKTRKLYTLSK